MGKKEEYIVYVHYRPGTTTPFYVGEGRYGRHNSGKSRNRFWNNTVSKYNGFDADIVVDDIINKCDAESIEAGLIQSLLDDGAKLCNISIGPPYGNHWSSRDSNYDITKHPMYGKRFPGGKASKRMTEWNRKRTGIDSPVFGIKRNDLAERNRHTELFRHRTKEILCIELGIKFNSIVSAKKYICDNYSNYKNPNINRALDTGSSAAGFHWKRTGTTYLE